MTRLDRFFKALLVIFILGTQLLIPLASVANENPDYEDVYDNISQIDDELLLDSDLELDIEPLVDDELQATEQSHVDYEQYEDDESHVDYELQDDEEQFLEDFDLDIDFDFESDGYYYNANSDEPLLAINEYAPEMLFADDMLEDIEEEEIFESFVALDAASAGVAGGLVQLVLEPVSSSLPSGVTMAQARAAAFNATTMVHPLFANETTNTVATAINGRFGRDAIFLGVSANGNRYRVMVGAFEGYVNRLGPANACNSGPCTITVPVNGVNRTFEVRMNAVFVPFGNYPSVSGANVQATSHYVNRNGELWRYLPNNVTTTGGFSRFLTGPPPSWMTQNTRYYSYDGIYFYRNPRNIRVNGAGAVNASNPFFNYFQYLSLRSSSRVTATQLDNFINNRVATMANGSNSVLIGQGRHFVNAQNRYGVNALMSFAKAIHESATGLSSIAINNNNVFGLNAHDAAPGANASVYRDVEHSINDYANHWMSRGYLWPDDWRYSGSHVGHKGSGMNLRYATDPYWGQKIAGWAMRVDRTLGNQDLNREQIAIRQDRSSVPVTNVAGVTLYTASPRQARFFSFLVTGTETNSRLRILTDPAIVNGVANQTALFNRNNAVGFIPNANVWLTGASRPNAGQQEPSEPITGVAFRMRTGVTVSNVNFRRGPSTNYGVISTIIANTNVRISGVRGNWYRVVHNSTTGWMHRDHVQQTRQNAVVRRDNIPVHARRNSNSQVLTRVNSGTRIFLQRRSPNWSRITINGHTGWIRNNQITMNGAGRPARVTANVNVHARPSASSNVIRRLPQNAEVLRLQRTTNGNGANQGWLQVRIRHANGTMTGWVRTNQVQNRVQTRRVIGSGTTNFRSGPGTSFAINRRLSSNTRVTLLAQTPNWSRVRVNINGRTEYGWIANSRISRLPLPAQP